MYKEYNTKFQTVFMLVYFKLPSIIFLVRVLIFGVKKSREDKCTSKQKHSVSSYSYSV